MKVSAMAKTHTITLNAAQARAIRRLRRCSDASIGLVSEQLIERAREFQSRARLRPVADDGDVARALRRDAEAARAIADLLYAIIESCPACGRVLPAPTIMAARVTCGCGHVVKNAASLTPAPEADPIADLARRATDLFNALSPDEQAAHRREQAISLAYGQAVLSGAQITKERVAELYDAQRAPEGR